MVDVAALSCNSKVVETVCDCDLETEEVQLQVIKALVHACTATTLAVHQASLLTAVKTIYTVSYRCYVSARLRGAMAIDIRSSGVALYKRRKGIREERLTVPPGVRCPR